MDKNPHQILNNDLEKIKIEFSKNNFNIILCQRPFLKTEFLNKLVNVTDFPVIFLDIDLLYSGYVKSRLIKKNDKVTLFRPNKENFNKILEQVIQIISQEKCLVIVDTLNGVYNLFEELESARFVNSTLMLLSSISRKTQSQIIVCCMTVKNEEGDWILSPGGKHVINSKNVGRFLLTTNDPKIILKPIDI